MMLRTVVAVISPRVVLSLLAGTAVFFASLGWVVVVGQDPPEPASVPEAYGGRLYRVYHSEKYKKLEEGIAVLKHKDDLTQVEKYDLQRKEYKLQEEGTLWPPENITLPPPKRTRDPGPLISRFYANFKELVEVWKPEPGDIIDAYIWDYFLSHTLIYMGTRPSVSPSGGGGAGEQQAQELVHEFFHMASTVKDEGLPKDEFVIVYNVRLNSMDELTKKGWNPIVRVNNMHRSWYAAASSGGGAAVVANARREISREYVHFHPWDNNCRQLAWGCCIGQLVDLAGDVYRKKNFVYWKGYFGNLTTFFLRIKQLGSEAGKVLHDHQLYVWVYDITGVTLAVTHKALKRDQETTLRRRVHISVAPTAQQLGSQLQYENRFIESNNPEGLLAIKLVAKPQFGDGDSTAGYEYIGVNVDWGVWIVAGTDPDKLATYHIPAWDLRDALALDVNSLLTLTADFNHPKPRLLEAKREELYQNLYHGSLFQYDRKLGVLVAKPLVERPDSWPIEQYERRLPGAQDKLVGEKWYSRIDDIPEEELPKKGDLLAIRVGEKHAATSSSFEEEDEQVTYAVYAGGIKRKHAVVNGGEGEGKIVETQFHHAVVHLHKGVGGSMTRRKKNTTYLISVDELDQALHKQRASHHHHEPLLSPSQQQTFFRVDNSYRARLQDDNPALGYRYHFNPEQTLDRILREVSDQPINCAPVDYMHWRIDVCGTLAHWAATGQLDDLHYLQHHHSED